MLPALYQLTYLITFCCYGSHIPGEENIISRKNHVVGTPRESANSLLAHAARRIMTDDSFVLDARQREIVLGSIRAVCGHRGWTLLAAHVRTSHVHAVIDAENKPEKVMNDLKSYATRALKCERRVWARHGSTRYLWTQDEVTSSVSYVVSKQGEPMAIHTFSAEPRP